MTFSRFLRGLKTSHRKEKHGASSPRHGRAATHRTVPQRVSFAISRRVRKCFYSLIAGCRVCASSIFQSLYIHSFSANGNWTVLILIALPHICFYNLALLFMNRGGDCAPQTHLPAGYTLFVNALFNSALWCVFLYFFPFNVPTTPLLLTKWNYRCRGFYIAYQLINFTQIFGEFFIFLFSIAFIVGEL